MTIVRPSRRLRSIAAISVAAAAWLAYAAPPAAAEEVLTAAAARELVIAAAARPSVHAERPELDAALEAAHVDEAQRTRLWEAVDAAVLPGAGSQLDGFLFLTREPEWLALRHRFAEYLDIATPAIAPEAIREFQSYGGVITLSGLARPTPALLAALAEFGGEDWGTALELPAVTTLTPEIAAGLAQTECLVILPRLDGLSAPSARALAAHQGVGVMLGGLDRLEPEAAAALAELRSMRGMLLPDLKSLDSLPLAGRLAQQDHVFLPRVQRLTADVARALSPNGGGELSLPGLEALSPDVAAILAASGYFGITLPGTLERESAAALVGHNGPLILAGRQPPRADAAAALARHPGEIRLPDLITLPADVATALAPHKGILVCEQLAEIPPGLATALARHRGGLWLGGVRTIDPEAARILATCPGPLALPGLEAVSPRALEALLDKQELEIPPRESLTLVPEADGSGDDFTTPTGR